MVKPNSIFDGFVTVGGNSVITAYAGSVIRNCIIRSAATSGLHIDSYMNSPGNVITTSVTVENCIITGNQNGILVGTSADIINCTITNNTGGSGVYVSSQTAAVTMTNCTITNNSNTGSGG